MELDSTILNVLAAGVAECHTAVTRHGGLLTSLFIAGLLGSITHCVGMCGPFVIGQVVARLETRPATEMREFHRLSGAALVPYHLGRATTYAALGALAAALAGGLIHLAGLKWLSAALLALAAVFFAGYALQRLGLPLPWAGTGSDGWWSRHIGRKVSPLFARPVGWRGYLLGVALGFLPCGLLYGALAAAAASAGPLSGALGMIAFTAGTVPALLAVGLAGHVAGRTWQPLAGRLMPAFMLVNAAALTYLAWRAVA